VRTLNKSEALGFASAGNVQFSLTISWSDILASGATRLASLTGFYMPGRDKFELLDSLGWILVLGHLLGVGVHGLTRMFTNGRKEGK